ncbi:MULTISPECIES: small acid-soluble spore protein SspI [Paenibacillus]|jgi:small acid-soluble spore protein I (minor)|uniref:Small, acid-soluble spore protein I n=1 Tax=Paenibacillus typhae TaxID=1174501 RepID=A0A1G9CVQ1_9BACL|nr:MULTISPECIES: small acid-soluble spore protein SspI [Paenibacillus]KUP23319.1 small, acid-soluble spore protein I [Paenibacillus sp. DMB5]MBY0014097.1 small acid-soluble spore protein SspI [Paenibacillus typhae]MDF9844335.1 small acid-soluble spore protein I (minor) [Paenibacillus sp. PastF-2]MDF9850876.1 small acid-soluble spore protein I (minor) [Paenibacillus sp. PastM-2]MDF9857510.1 small acid-soluble spore protein I (minor) [Paenibacillus sp. PastF-1]
MPVTIDLRQAILHKVHGQSEEDLRHMIEGSVDGPEAALPGLGVVFEMVWKDIGKAKQDHVIGLLHRHLEEITPGSVTTEQS